MSDTGSEDELERALEQGSNFNENMGVDGAAVAARARPGEAADDGGEADSTS